MHFPPFFQATLLVPVEKTHLTLLSVDSKAHSLPSNVTEAQIFTSQAHVPTEHNNAFKKRTSFKSPPNNPIVLNSQAGKMYISALHFLNFYKLGTSKCSFFILPLFITRCPFQVNPERQIPKQMHVTTELYCISAHPFSLLLMLPTSANPKG